jgi:hypothetical protein
VFGREKDMDGGKMKFFGHLILDVALASGGKRKKCGFNFLFLLCTVAPYL